MLHFKFKMAYLFQVVFFLLIHSIFITAEGRQHICQYDELRKGQPDFKEIEKIEEIKVSEDISQEQSSISDVDALVSANVLSTEDDFSQLRVKISYNNLEEATKHCTTDKESKKDAEDKDYQCTENDILTDDKKNKIKIIVQKAVDMHTSRLKVKSLEKGFKVPAFTDGFCSRLTIPDEDKNTGILDADLVLYVSVAPFKDKPNNAYGFPCGIEKETKRPLIGGIVIDPKHIDESDYTTRVLAHEIGHILGFDLDIIGKKKPIETKGGVRNKPNVNEFRGNKVIEKVKEHYDCGSATGMEVEDQKEHSRTAWRGSLWESRNAKDELMAGVVRKGFYTYFTLAFFEDLGFYKPIYEKAEHMEWGYKMGCDFLTKPCIERGISNFPTMFCTEANKEKLFCTANGRTMGTCVGLNTNHRGHLDTFHKYFPVDTTTGFPHLLTDNCPYIEEKEGADCQSTAQTPALPGKKGLNSRCIQNTDEKAKSAFGGHNGICAEKTADSENEISLTFSEVWKPVTCNTQKSDTMKYENSFNKTKYYCSKIEEIPKKDEKKEEVTDSFHTPTTSKNDKNPEQKSEKDVNIDSQNLNPKTGSIKNEHSLPESKTNLGLDTKSDVQQNGANPLVGKKPEGNEDASESLLNIPDSLTNNTITNTNKEMQNNVNSATHIQTGIALLFFAVLLIY